MGVGIIFLEQLYPWPEEELQAALDEHPEAQEIVWVQEEPANMGAFSYVMPELRRMAGRPRGAEREAVSERESGDRVGEGARDGREDSDRSGVWGLGFASFSGGTPPGVFWVEGYCLQ